MMSSYGVADNPSGETGCSTNGIDKQLVILCGNLIIRNNIFTLHNKIAGSGIDIILSSK